MLAADGVRGVVQAGLAALLLSGHAHVWELAVGGALYGAAASFFNPASTALVPETVPAGQLQQANSLLGLPQSFFSVAGPAVGGTLIAVFGPGWLFAADAASFFASLACLALLRVPRRMMPPPASFLADLAEGWHELAIRPWYWVNLLAHACCNFVVPALFVLGPVIAARSLGGASAWGFISAGFGVGAIAGGLIALRVKPRRPLVVATLLTTLIALPPLTLALTHSVALIVAALVVFAFEVVWSNSMFTATIQALIPDQVRSRVDSYDMLISIVIMPVGYVVAGPLASSVGITTTLVGAAIIGAVPAALTALVPGNRAVRRTPDGGIVGPEGEIVGQAGEIVGSAGDSRRVGCGATRLTPRPAGRRIHG